MSPETSPVWLPISVFRYQLSEPRSPSQAYVGELRLSSREYTIMFVADTCLPFHALQIVNAEFCLVYAAVKYDLVASDYCFFTGAQVLGFNKHNCRIPILSDFIKSSENGLEQLAVLVINFLEKAAAIIAAQPEGSF